MNDSPQNEHSCLHSCIFLTEYIKFDTASDWLIQNTVHTPSNYSPIREDSALHFWTYFDTILSCEEWATRFTTAPIYCFGRIVDFVVLLVYYSGGVDRSGSLSSGAFNQLRLATLEIVLTILYLLKTVLQWSLLQCLNSLYKSDEVF